MKKIVLIEDDADLFALLKYNLEKEGFAMVGSQTGKGAIELCRRERPDLILLDIMLPDSDGLDICKGIRSHGELAHIPLIFLTARASETDRIVGLELGANDYIVKPFFVRELIARIKIQCRTSAAPARTLQSGPLELDRSACRVHLNGQELALTATEFRLLEFLMTRPGVVFSREHFWIACGATIARSPTARWMFTCSGCARRSNPTPPTRLTSAQSGVSGTVSTRAARKWGQRGHSANGGPAFAENECPL